MFKEESHLVLWDVLIKTLELRTSTSRTNVVLYNCLPVSLEKTLTVYYFFNQSQNSSSVETSVLCFDWLKDQKRMGIYFALADWNTVVRKYVLFTK